MGSVLHCHCPRSSLRPNPWHRLQVAEIVRRCPAKQLMQLYKVAAYDGPDQFLQHVATVSCEEFVQ